MPIITLQTRLLLDNSDQNQEILLFIQTVHEFLMDGIISRFSRYKQKSWSDLEKKQPDIVNLTNNQITIIAKNYLGSFKYKLDGLSSKNLVQFHLQDGEIFESSIIDQIDKLKVAVYFASEPLELITNFGAYLLLSDQNDIKHTNTFMLKLSSDLRINSYQ